MADLAGAYATNSPIISNNTAEILRHRAEYYSGTGSISLPLVKGSRYIVYSVLTAGATISIGFGQVAGTITDSRFTFTQAAGPLDLSNLFRSAPFTQYKTPSAAFVYFIITGTGAIIAAITSFNG